MVRGLVTLSVWGRADRRRTYPGGGRDPASGFHTIFKNQDWISEGSQIASKQGGNPKGGGNPWIWVD